MKEKKLYKIKLILLLGHFLKISVLFLVCFSFLLSSGKTCSAEYISGGTLYPNCSSMDSNCGFSIEENSSIAFIGDSWTAGWHFVFPFYYYINANYDFSGIGYVPVDSYAYNRTLSYNYPSLTSAFDNFPDPVPTEYNLATTTAGTWTDTIKLGASLGPNLTKTNSSDITTPASKSVMCTGTDFTIYYLKQSGGGSFDYSIDSGSTTTVSTDNASESLGTVNISDQTETEHTITMTVSVAGAEGVTLFGVDCSIANSGGIKIHKLGASGSRGSWWAGAYGLSASLWQSGIASLNPDIVVISLGTNDIAVETAEEYIDYIETIIDNIKTANSTIDIILIPPTISARTGPAGDVSAYYPVLQELAEENGYGYLEASNFFDSYEEANAVGLWENDAHMTIAGDQIFADILLDYLLLTPAPVVNSVTGQNPQSVEGSESITINGENFVSKSTATIGGIVASGVGFVSSESFTAIAPAHDVGTYDVAVTNYIQSTTCSNCMTYEIFGGGMPITWFNPPASPVGGFD